MLAGCAGKVDWVVMHGDQMYNGVMIVIHIW